MVDEVAYLTPQGKEELERELQQLIERRPVLAAKLKEAVAMGDLKENADYHDTKEQMGMLEGRIQQIEATLRHAVVVDKGGNDEVGLGSIVTIVEEGSTENEVYTIVGAAEANPREGKISVKSPIGAALMHRKKGDKVRVVTPNGETVFKIKKIE
ncbi:MAG: transcription elongation factor GreA [Anaerolineae bacterium]|nr:transcription elongation factor GreA [Anaerolineae bacterium]MDW8173192.1 transcription elongation factor GreA [Anaerolineae bacterium]